MTGKTLPMSRANLAGAAILVLCLILLSGCGNQKIKLKGFSGDTKAKLTKLKNEDKSKSKYLSIQAKKRTEGAGVGVPIPYDLFSPFRVELTFGLFSKKKAENLGDGTFGLQITNADNSGEYYRVFARHQTEPEGLEVFAETHLGPQGEPEFIADTRVDAVAETDGITLTLSARPSDGSSPPVTLATVPFASPRAPHQPGFSVSGIQDRSRVGFSNLTIPLNNPPLAYITGTNLGREVERYFMEGVRTLFDVLRLANNGVPEAEDVTEMQTLLTSAQLNIQLSGGVAVALEPNPASKTVISQTAKIDKKLTQLQARLDPSNPKGAGKVVVSTLTGKLFGPVKKVLDALPDLGGARQPPEGLEFFTQLGSYYIVNQTGKPIDIKDVVIDITRVTYWMIDEETKEEVPVAGEPFRVSYREEAPEIYNDDPDNYADRVFPDGWIWLNEYVDWQLPEGAVRLRFSGTITVEIRKFPRFSLEYVFTYPL